MQDGTECHNAWGIVQEKKKYYMNIFSFTTGESKMFEIGNEEQMLSLALTILNSLYKQKYLPKYLKNISKEIG